MIKNGPLFFKKFSYGKNQLENGHSLDLHVDPLDSLRLRELIPTENKLVASPVQRALFVV